MEKLSPPGPSGDKMSDINEVVNEVMGTEPTVTAPENSEPAVTAPATAETSEVPTAQSNQANRLSRSARAEKEAKELRSHYDRQLSERDKQISEMRREVEQFQPLKPYLTQLQQQQQLAKQQGLQEQFQKNPLELMQQLVDQRLQQQIAPLQQTIEQQRATEYVNQSLDGLKTQFGPENFEKHAPVMSGLLDEVRSRYGVETSNLLVRNPVFLYMAAKGFADHNANFEQQKLNQQTQIQNQANKEEVLRLNSGISKPNRIAKPMAPKGKNQILEDAVKSLGF